jgi:hypothetical protein
LLADRREGGPEIDFFRLTVAKRRRIEKKLLE